MNPIFRGIVTALHESLTLLAGLAGEAPCAGAAAVDALAVAAAVGHHALVVAQLALAALPAGVAPARPLLVVAVPGAQHGADACKRGRMRLMIPRNLS